MAAPSVLQDWVTIAGGAASTVVQPANGHVDALGFHDACFFVEISDKTGSPRLILQSSPTVDEVFFQTLTTVTAIGVTAAPTGWLRGGTLARRIRWSIDPGGGGAWTLTFRVLVALAGKGARKARQQGCGCGGGATAGAGCGCGPVPTQSDYLHLSPRVVERRALRSVGGASWGPSVPGARSGTAPPRPGFRPWPAQVISIPLPSGSEFVDQMDCGMACAKCKWEAEGAFQRWVTACEGQLGRAYELCAKKETAWEKKCCQQDADCNFDVCMTWTAPQVFQSSLTSCWDKAKKPAGCGPCTSPAHPKSNTTPASCKPCT